MAKILLIDADPGSLGFIRRYLQRDGHYILQAKSRTEARIKLDEYDFDLVVCTTNIDDFEYLKDLVPRYRTTSVVVSEKSSDAALESRFIPRAGWQDVCEKVKKILAEKSAESP